MRDPNRPHWERHRHRHSFWVMGVRVGYVGVAKSSPRYRWTFDSPDGTSHAGTESSCRLARKRVVDLYSAYIKEKEG